MEPINKSFKNLTNNNNFKNRFDTLKQEVLKHPHILAFIEEHQDNITDEMINRSLGKLYEYINQSKECDQCESLEGCKNMLQGYHPHLVLEGKIIGLKYDRCPRKVIYDDRSKFKSLIKSMYIPKDILQATIDQIDLDDPARFKAISMAQDFVENYQDGNNSKALFIHGPFGTGKTYILGAIANELAQRNVHSMLIYVPEFMREIKGSLQDSSFNEKIEAVKMAPVLMLDDIGAESMSSWIRDDILGAILQYRMLENKPTFFTSNFDFTQLEHHLSFTQRGEEERVKAARIMERIKYLAKPVELKGKNRRSN